MDPCCFTLHASLCVCLTCGFSTAVFHWCLYRPAWTKHKHVISIHNIAINNQTMCLWSSVLSFCTSSIAWYQSKIMEVKKKEKNRKKVKKRARRLLATFRDISAACGQMYISLSWTHLMLKLLIFTLGVGRELIIVMLARKEQKKKTWTHIWDGISHGSDSSLTITWEDLMCFLDLEEDSNVKQANLKMLLSALDLCVSRISVRYFNRVFLSQP